MESTSATEFAVWRGPPKPVFTLDDLEKRPVSLDSARVDIVIVHFFATWCEPCVEELPALRRLMARADPRHLRVIAISVAEVDVRVRGFFERRPVNFPVLLDRDRSVTRSWNVSALPTSFVLDRDLVPRLVTEREYDWDHFDPAHILTVLRRQFSTE